MDAANINNNPIGIYSKAEQVKNTNLIPLSRVVDTKVITEIKTSDNIEHLAKDSETVVKAVEKFVDNTQPSGLGIVEKHRAEQLTSLFENSTTELQYDYS